MVELLGLIELIIDLQGSLMIFAFFCVNQSSLIILILLVDLINLISDVLIFGFILCTDLTVFRKLFFVCKVVEFSSLMLIQVRPWLGYLFHDLGRRPIRMLFL